MMSLIGCGTATFTDPDEYRVRIPGAQINLVLTEGGDFKARVTWVNLRRLKLVRIEECLPRIAFLTLVAGPAFITFPIGNRLPVLWGGIEVGHRDIVLHCQADRIHQRTTGPSRWGMISLAPNDLAGYGRALADVELAPPSTAKFLRPPFVFTSRLLSLHRRACQLVERKPGMILHKEVARAFEQNLVHALINCLVAEENCGERGRDRHAEVMARFEDALASRCQGHTTSELCETVGVHERMLRLCCGKFLRVSPGNYGRLRRLTLVRTRLQRVDPETVTVAEIARQFGFSELGRFAGEYRMVFGESPSATMRAHQLKRSH